MTKKLNRISISGYRQFFQGRKRRRLVATLVGVQMVISLSLIHISPLAILYDEGENPTEPLMAKIAEGKRKEAIQFLKELHNEVMGEGEFNYSFVEDEVEKLYDDDKRTTRIYVTFAGLAICVSCLGLFGLSLYDIRQRYREIALRKVNGATGDVYKRQV